MPAEKPDKVVLDTNILVSLIINQDTDQLADWVAEYGITFYACPELLQELRSTFAKPEVGKFLKAPVDFYIEFIESLCQVVIITRRFDRAPDPDDNFLFDLAYTVKSYFLVTGDRLVLGMKQVNKIRVVSPSAFYCLLNENW